MQHEGGLWPQGSKGGLQRAGSIEEAEWQLEREERLAGKNRQGAVRSQREEAEEGSTETAEAQEAGVREGGTAPRSGGRSCKHRAGSMEEAERLLDCCLAGDGEYSSGNWGLKLGPRQGGGPRQEGVDRKESPPPAKARQQCGGMRMSGQALNAEYEPGVELWHGNGERAPLWQLVQGRRRQRQTRAEDQVTDEGMNSEQPEEGLDQGTANEEPQDFQDVAEEEGPGELKAAWGQEEAAKV